MQRELSFLCLIFSERLFLWWCGSIVPFSFDGWVLCSATGDWVDHFVDNLPNIGAHLLVVDVIFLFLFFLWRSLGGWRFVIFLCNLSCFFLWSFFLWLQFGEVNLIILSKSLLLWLLLIIESSSVCLNWCLKYANFFGLR